MKGRAGEWLASTECLDEQERSNEFARAGKGSSTLGESSFLIRHIHTHRAFHLCRE